MEDLVTDYSVATGDILERIRRAEAEERRRRAEWDAECRSFEDSGAATRRIIQTDVLPNLRPITVAEYAAFVRGYLEAGGDIGYVRDYPLRRSSSYATALRDFTLPPLYGAQTINVLVPAGITVTCDPNSGWGHATVLRMDGYRIEHGRLELISDVAAYLRGEFAEAEPVTDRVWPVALSKVGIPLDEYSENDPWAPEGGCPCGCGGRAKTGPEYSRAASGNPLPVGWRRGTCWTHDGGVLVNRDGQCVDCAGGR